MELNELHVRKNGAVAVCPPSVAGVDDAVGGLSERSTAAAVARSRLCAELLQPACLEAQCNHPLAAAILYYQIY